MKTESTFYPASLLERGRANAATHAWAQAIRERTVAAAEPWLRLTDDELWELMFGHTLPRSWMVWSNGFCPACREDVPMYTWRTAPLAEPWKITCPHCREAFPKNDFHAYYRSGLDAHGVFDPALAGRALLFNVQHPDPDDPKHRFGVDDGAGYVDGDNCWRFIGAYLIYGQWKQAVHAGITACAAAYVVTGEAAYAHKAGILLDRVADLYPGFDFGQQGIVYERQGDRGYVSTWHDACLETRTMAQAYDQVFEAIQHDRELVEFLAAKAARFGLDNPKTSFADIQRNIEGGILRHALANPDGIHTNYPLREIALATIHVILGGPANRAEADAIIDAMLTAGTAVDGVTGEKGLAAYSSFVIKGLAGFLARMTRLDPLFLADVLARHPRLRQTYRFHIDTWCCEQRYYPQIGDSRGFAKPCDDYLGVVFEKPGSIEPSAFTFLWQLHQLTGDPAYAQVLYHANDQCTDDLPHDLFADDPAAIQEGVRRVIDAHGAALELGSIDKQEWHLAILRAGDGRHSRAAWMCYDAGGRHSHLNGMNLGLFAKGLDLMPDSGYPPVQFGGWQSPRANWYRMAAAHNTVVVDGKDHERGKDRGIPLGGRTTLWSDGKLCRAMRASGPELIAGKQFERTILMIEIDATDFYLLDVFRVIGGSDHAKFFHSHFGQTSTTGLTLTSGEDYGFETLMRNFAADPAPAPGWQMDWQIEDRHGLLPSASDLHLRYTGLTSDAEVHLAEGWIATGSFEETEETWIPRLMVRRRQAGELQSTFVALIEPYEGCSKIASVRRLPLTTPSGAAYPDSFVAVEVRLADGRTDLIATADMESQAADPGSTRVQSEWDLEFTGDTCMVRRDAAGEVERLALCRANTSRLGEFRAALPAGSDCIELGPGPQV